MNDRFIFRSVEKREAEETADIEEICFPPNEACSRKDMRERVEHSPEDFLVLYDTETRKIAGFVNGIATDEEKFRDEFFTDIRLHNKNGKNIMILGLDVLPEYRHQGLAHKIIEEYKRRERDRNRSQLILTCLEEKVKFYEGMGFKDLGLSASSWGGESWHEMKFLL